MVKNAVIINTQVDTNLRIDLYNVLIRSILLYGLNILGLSRKSTYKYNLFIQDA